MRVLVVCDDRWHPAATIRAGLAALADEFSFDWIEDAADWSAERLADYEVVLLTKANNRSASDETPWVTPDVEAAFAAYVENGNGLLAVHSGSAGYQDTPVLRALLGGVFVRHPAQCNVTVAATGSHPLTVGVEAFTVHDEHYFMDLDDLTADVFLATISEHGTEPGGWTRTAGAGRVCMLTPGHNLDVWLQPGYQTMIRRALRWSRGE